MAGRLKPAATALAAMAGLALSVPAQAEVEVVTYQYSPPDLGGGISVQQPTPSNFYGVAGRFLLTTRNTGTGEIQQIYSFCIDALTGLYTYRPYSVAAADSLFADASKRAQLAALLTYANQLIAAAGDEAEQSQIATAFALAVWEVTYDHGGAGYDLASGIFSVYGGFEPLIARGNGYLANVANGSWTGDARRLRALVARTPGDTQNQIFLTPGAVPEPGAWAMLILGFGLIGGVLRRGRRRRSVPALRTA